MSTAIQSDQPWQLTHPPEKWLEILQQALHAHRANPQDTEAMEAIQQANEALQVYDSAESATPRERIESGAREGIQGLGRAGADLGRGVKNTLIHPIDTLSELVPNLLKLPGQIANDFSSNDQNAVGHGVGTVASLLLPFARTGPGSFTRSATGPTVASTAAKAIKAPVDAVSALVKRPGLRNQLLEEQITTEASNPARVQASTRALDELANSRATRTQQTVTNAPVNEAILQARKQLLEKQLGRAATQDEILELRRTLSEHQVEQAPLRTTTMKQQVDRGGPTLENLELRNEMLRRRLAGEEMTVEDIPDRETTLQDIVNEPMRQSQPTMDPMDWVMQNAGKTGKTAPTTLASKIGKVTKKK